jgi:hypothetical protein
MNFQDRTWKRIFLPIFVQTMIDAANKSNWSKRNGDWEAVAAERYWRPEITGLGSRHLRGGALRFHEEHFAPADGARRYQT